MATKMGSYMHHEAPINRLTSHCFRCLATDHALPNVVTQFAASSAGVWGTSPALARLAATFQYPPNSTPIMSSCRRTSTVILPFHRSPKNMHPPPKQSLGSPSQALINPCNCVEMVHLGVCSKSPHAQRHRHHGLRCLTREANRLKH